MVVALLIVYSLAIFFVSVVGGTIPRWIELTHSRMQSLISLIAGLMLGVASFHLLPHAVGALGSPFWACVAMMAGLLTTFMLLRAFHFHHHEPADAELRPAHDPHLSVHEAVESASAPATVYACEHDHGHAHPHGHAHDHADHSHTHGFGGPGWSWIGIALGLAIHTLLDGVALGSSVLIEGGPSAWKLPAGLATFLAIILHKPLDALSIASVMKRDRWSYGAQNVVNLLFASLCPIGAFAFLVGVQAVEDYAGPLIGIALAFSSGVFLCISLSDLLPEVQFHHHDRVRLTALLLLGVGVALALEALHGSAHLPKSQTTGPTAEEALSVGDPTS
jgi:zinc and cadmium transporter